jgi:ABC-type glycerol-3-phosphate transport system permease component
MPWRSCTSGGRDAILALVLVGLLLPHQVLALPLFVLCWKLGIMDSYAALVLPFIVSPFGIFLFRQFFKSISDDLMHAARLDGYSELGIVFQIMLPLARPAVIAFSILSITSHWYDLFWPLIANEATNGSHAASMICRRGAVFKRSTCCKELDDVGQISARHARQDTLQRR